MSRVFLLVSLVACTFLVVNPTGVAQVHALATTKVESATHETHAASPVDDTLRLAAAVTHELETPAPVARVGRRGEAAAVEARRPLLPGVAGAVAAFDFERRVPSGLVGGADARPVALR